jgi:rare lipoprotein A
MMGGNRGVTLGMAWRIGLAVMVAVALAGCAELNFFSHAAKKVDRSMDQPTPDGLKPTQIPGYKIGNPYQVAGVWYYPAEDYDYNETGIASWYGPDFHGKRTANGEIYDMNDLTAAHKTLPMPSIVRVTNLESGRTLALRVNDRGPFVNGRIIDVSRRAAQLLGFEGKGTAKVKVEVMAGESRQIAATMRGQTVLASSETPITIDRMPKPAVSQESLAPPPGARAQPGPAPRPIAATTPEPATPVAAPAKSPMPAAISTVPVRDTGIYIQAGAFSQYLNAERVRAALGSVANGAKIEHAMVRERDIYRVRIGPLASVEDADAALDKVIGAGYPEARIIVD